MTEGSREQDEGESAPNFMRKVVGTSPSKTTRALLVIFRLECGHEELGDAREVSDTTRLCKSCWARWLLGDVAPPGHKR
jgi:hypothetical protein